MGIVNKFYKHYQNVDRRYGKHPMYKSNEHIYAFGEECDILKDKFEEWKGNDTHSKIHNFIRCEDGIEYAVFHISWCSDIKKVLPFWVIDSEEVHYNFYQIKRPG